jgi:predicted ATPase
MDSQFTATRTCECLKRKHKLHKIVITGGPGAGKSAILEMARMQFCPHVALLPEAATILFRGGFWREDSRNGREVAQRAIFHIQKEMEHFVSLEQKYALAICDRGTLDGLAYWPKSQKSFFDELQLSRKKELLNYSAVIHLRTPSKEKGYNHQNPVRIETVTEAQEMDARIEKAWEGHPRRYFIDSTESFMEKAEKAFHILRQEIPSCCTSPGKWAP